MIEVDLTGKVVVVTGAGGRLGSRLVHRFADQGATIAAIVRNEQQARDIPFPQHAEGWAFPADVTNEKVVQTTFRQIAEQFGRIDVLIHAVGMWKSTPMHETSLEEWDRITSVNLRSAFLCFREAIQVMRVREGGRIIGFSSFQGLEKGRAGQAAYGASKAGVIRLVEAVASEYRDQGITAYAIAPSTILFQGKTEQEGVSVDHVVDLCLYLCTPPAEALSGSTLRADG